MPWYKVALTVYAEGEGPEQAQDKALSLVGDEGCAVVSAAWPAQLSPAQLAAHRRLRAILAQAAADSAAGLLATDPRYAGLRFGPQAAAALAALELEERLPE